MKDLLIDSMMNNIQKHNDFDESKLKIIKYGLSMLYINITKLGTLFLIGYFLGILKTLLMLMAFYNILRLTGFGVHAKKSLHCWIASLTTFLIIPFICENITIDFTIKIIISITSIILLSIYAPADTEKRPLIHKNKRVKFKVITILMSILYFVALIITENNLLSNCILFGEILEVIAVLPITYKLFGVKYKNYKNRKEF